MDPHVAAVQRRNRMMVARCVAVVVAAVAFAVVVVFHVAAAVAVELDVVSFVAVVVPFFVVVV